MIDQQTKTRFPAPLYAAAGAGDLAYQQLRKLPAKVTELSDRAAASLRVANEHANSTAAELREKAGTTDFDKLRASATNTAVTLAQAASERAQAASERALAVYTALIAHGERVVGTGIAEAADVVHADLATTEAPKAVEATADSTPKPRKRTRPAAD